MINIGDKIDCIYSCLRVILAMDDPSTKLIWRDLCTNSLYVDGWAPWSMGNFQRPVLSRHCHKLHMLPFDEKPAGKCTSRSAWISEVSQRAYRASPSGIVTKPAHFSAIWSSTGGILSSVINDFSLPRDSSLKILALKFSSKFDLHKLVPMQLNAERPQIVNNLTGDREIHRTLRIVSYSKYFSNFEWFSVWPR